MEDEQPKLGGRYVLGDVIGRGGMAEVRRAHDERLGRTVAIKQLKVDLAGDSTFQARFRREAQSAAGLNHPNIVSVYDTGVEHRSDIEVPYIVMEYVDGPTLRDVLRSEHKIMPERALELTQGVLNALEYSHKAGIIHRDIKPANVMLTGSGQVKVMDFGIARAVSDTAASMTQTAAVIGTAQYLSPEQARGETVDARSDVYSAGCLLYELLTGRPPFVGDSPVSVAYQHVRETPIAPSSIGEGDVAITPDMDRIVLKSLAKSPSDRFASARDMREDIDRLLGGHQVTAVIPASYDTEATAALMDSALATTATQVLTPAQPVTSQPQRAYPEVQPPPKRGGTGAVALILLLVLALLGAGGFGVYTYLQNKNAPTMVSVPTLRGFTPETAESRLADAGLKPSVKSISGPSDATVGKVVDQDPPGSTKVQQGSTVTITINVGPDTTAIPHVQGMNKDQAAQVMKDAGFAVNLVAATDEPAAAKVGEVISTSPGGGVAAAKGSTVTITYAKGDIKMPSLKGFTETAALQKLAESGFTGAVTVRKEPGNPIDAVLNQTPAADTIVAKTSAITIVVATAAPTPSPTPPAPSAPASTNSPTGTGYKDKTPPVEPSPSAKQS